MGPWKQVWASWLADGPLITNKCYIVIYIIIQHHNDTISIQTQGQRRSNKRRRNEDTRRLLYKDIFTSHFIARVRKGCLRVACERMLETEHKLHILTPLLWPSRCVFLVLLILKRGHGVHSAGCWLPLLHLISIFSGLQLIRASSPFGRVGPSLPHLVSTVWRTTGNCLGPKLNWVK